MNARSSKLRVVENPQYEIPARSTGRVLIGVIAVLIALAVVPLLVKSFLATVQPVPQAQAEPASSEAAATWYYPAQYPNQAQNRAPEEHIQAF